jgi:capsular polysaccharide biosynthesis protein
MSWTNPRFPVERPPGSLTVHTVEDATLTRVSHGDLRVIGRPNLWVRGAVYDAKRRLVPASQRLGGITGDFVAASDPAAIPRRPSSARLDGKWLYGGHWMPTFGHFITETLTSLWPGTAVLDGIVFHGWLGHPGVVHPWQQRLLDLAGATGVPIRIVTDERWSVERLLVPDRSFVTNGWAYSEAVEVWRRVSAPLHTEGGPERIYLSRTRFNAARAAKNGPLRSTAERDAALDRDFDRAGFRVIAPEELHIDEQLALVAGAHVIAGASGSALHLAAFAGRPSSVIEVGDMRVPLQGLPNQKVVDAVCGHRHAFVPVDASAAAVLDKLEVRPRSQQIGKRMTASPSPQSPSDAAPEPAPPLSRWQVVQKLINLHDNPRYLEIGVSEGVTFHRVQAARQVAVDPAFLFDWEVEQRKRADTTTYHQVTSDEYFGSIIADNETFDVIFLDGLHTFEQTLRDLVNALDHLSPEGVIVIDDVCPSSYHASLPDHLQSVQVRQYVEDTSKDWMGDVYRLVWFIDTFFQTLSYRTVANNHGQAVVWRERRRSVRERQAREIAELSFEDFVLNQDVLQRRPLSRIVREIQAAAGRSVATGGQA